MAVLGPGWEAQAAGTVESAPGEGEPVRVLRPSAAAGVALDEVQREALEALGYVQE